MNKIPVNVKTVPSKIVTVEDGLQKLIYRFSVDTEMFTIALSFPYVDCAGVWHPFCRFDRANGADYGGYFHTMTSWSAPVVSVFNADSVNRCTVALSEAKELVRIYAGIREEDGMFHIKLEIPKVESSGNNTREVVLWLDTRSKSFAKTLGAVSSWWEDECDMKAMEVPEDARLPMYSTWYSYHQRMKADALEEECRLAKKLGFHSVIVDDGWQTDDNNRGYAFCGDWKACLAKFPDMPSHVEKIHQLGMKYMLWYSVPFVGKNSHMWERFKDRLLYINEDLGAGVLDPRYPEVREYLVDTYCKAVRNFDLDGLKLDFIDQFTGNNKLPPYQEGMDYPSVQPAIDRLMVDIAHEVQKVRPNILIEFRQPYIGPNIRKYGNILRVSDCPNSGLSNHVGTVDLRLLSGDTAVHSDMVMWHQDEAPEEIALQLIACIFATVQISTLLENLSEQQRRTLSFWVDFMTSNRKLLVETPLEVVEPQNLYPEVRVSDDKEVVVALYSKNRVVKYENGKKMTVLNGTKDDAVRIEIIEPVKTCITQRSCCGEILDMKVLTLEPGIHRILATTGGVITLN